MVAPIVGSNLQRIGRKNSILIGYSLCITATFGFGLISYIPQRHEFDPTDPEGKRKLEGDYE